MYKVYRRKRDCGRPGCAVMMKTVGSVESVDY